MNIKPLHKDFKKPTKGTDMAGAWDLYMPAGGIVYPYETAAVMAPLGFSLEIPENNVGLILPRSGKGIKSGLMLNNTCGVIDADYRGECVAALRVLDEAPLSWAVGDRLLQLLIVPVTNVTMNIVDELGTTERGTGGLGSTGV